MRERDRGGGRGREEVANHIKGGFEQPQTELLCNKSSPV